jgi:hypothetical protein
MVDGGWDKDVVSLKQWRSHCQPSPAVAALGNGWLLRPLLSKGSSDITSS